MRCDFAGQAVKLEVMGEFDLIETYFKRPARRATLGVGDDCALLPPSAGQQLAISCDMLVEGRHFLSTVNPRHLGHKALAVNLSDLAACGAEPKSFLLALALPHIEPEWLASFAQGLWALADQFQCDLVGGDTTRGPLNICITVMGEVPLEKALLRSAAKVGDDIYVSGSLGDARLALEVFRGRLQVTSAIFERARARMEQPSPRVALGLALRGLAHAAADISDGLLGDLQHILKASAVGARIEAHTVAATMSCAEGAGLRWPDQLALSLAGGDDYELVFTAAADQRAAVFAAAGNAQTPVTRIGRITSEPGLYLVDAQGLAMPNTYHSFDHFHAD
jgi:thiamine-monophosphate kinase